jgi:CheY-like chemotaxis protein
MSDATHFPLFDPNSEQHNSGKFSAERFSSACEDAEARERMSAMYLEEVQSSAQNTRCAPAPVENAEVRPDGLDTLLARASEESAAQSNSADAANAAERTPEQIEAERQVAEALAAVNAGTQSDVPVNADVEAQMQAAAAEEADTQEFVHEIQQEVTVAEISAAAEEFVAEQTGHAAPALENVEPQATCGSLPPAAESFAAENSAKENSSTVGLPAIPEASRKSETPWEPVAEAAKRYNLAETESDKPLAQAAAAGATPTAASAHAASAQLPNERSKGNKFTSRLKNFWGDSNQPSLAAAIGHATTSAPAQSTPAPAAPVVDAHSTLHATAPAVQEFIETVAKLAPVAPPKIDEPAPQADAAPVRPERRRKRRALISAPLRVRTKNLTGQGLDEVASTVDVSRLGVLFHTNLDCYMRGMELAVTFPYSKMPHGIQAEQQGMVARVQDLGDGRRAVAVVLGVVPGQHIVDTNGRKVADTPVQLTSLKAAFAANGMMAEKLTSLDVKKPVVLAVDGEVAVRESLKCCLEKEGYEVIALSSAKEGRNVLDMMTPALIIAEVEGEGLPGYDLCAHVKQTPRLRHIPVVLTTGSAYPSDYSNAHSLGAVVCMAKPYKQERIAHIARLLAPPPSAHQNSFTPRPADPSRMPKRDTGLTGRNGNGAAKKTAAPKNGTAKPAGANGNGKGIFKFPTFR